MASKQAALALLASALTLMACTRDVSVDVTKTGEAVAFTATRGKDAKPPCVQGVIVTQAGTDIADTPPVWELSTAENGRCENSFRYGDVPVGYSQSGPAPRLLVGSRYMIEISGPGVQGGQEFTMRAGDGVLTDALTP